MQMEKLVLSLFTFLAPLLVVAQKELVLKGTVIDENDKSILAYVNIGMIAKPA